MTTAQELFDKVATHLLKQNAQSRDDEGCQYRGDGGMMCAIGCLIPDSAYTVDMENLSVGDLVQQGMLPQDLRLVFIEHLDLLADLQTIHDSQLVSNWKYCLMRAAEQHDLRMVP